jgi:hypothetical protein
MALNKTIYFLHDYNWIKGTLISVGKVNNKILAPFPSAQTNVFYIKKDKCAFENELVCVVWESWKGRNGRGGYRLEKVLYPQHRIPAKDVSYQPGMGQGRVVE